MQTADDYDGVVPIDRANLSGITQSRSMLSARLYGYGYGEPTVSRFARGRSKKDHVERRCLHSSGGGGGKKAGGWECMHVEQGGTGEGSSLRDMCESPCSRRRRRRSSNSSSSADRSFCIK